MTYLYVFLGLINKVGNRKRWERVVRSWYIRWEWVVVVELMVVILININAIVMNAQNHNKPSLRPHDDPGMSLIIIIIANCCANVNSKSK